MDRLWSITEDLNILYKENWTRLAAQEVQHFQVSVRTPTADMTICRFTVMPIECDYVSKERSIKMRQKNTKKEEAE